MMTKEQKAELIRRLYIMPAYELTNYLASTEAKSDNVETVFIVMAIRLLESLETIAANTAPTGE